MVPSSCPPSFSPFLSLDSASPLGFLSPRFALGFHDAPCLFWFCPPLSSVALIATAQGRWRVATRAFNRNRRSCREAGSGITIRKLGVSLCTALAQLARSSLFAWRPTRRQGGANVSRNFFSSLLLYFSSLLLRLSRSGDAAGVAARVSIQHLNRALRAYPSDARISICAQKMHTRVGVHFFLE